MTPNLTLDDYVRILWRRKWIIVTVLVIVPVVAVFLAARQPKVYESTSEVLLSRQDLGSELLNLQNPNLYTDPTRFAATQAAIARTPQVAARVIQATHVRMSTGAFLGASKVNPNPNADYLVFTVQNENPDLAARLASSYARQFTVYRRQLDTGALTSALAEINARLKELRKSGGTSSSEYSSLQDHAQQLRLYENLQTSNTYVLKEAQGASKIKPNPKRSALFGILGGLVLGVCLAFLAEAVDRRVHTSEEIEHLLELPLLARIPQPSRENRRNDELVMLTQPTSPDAEAYRVFRTNLQFLNADLQAKLIMVTSSVAREGKSTTAASLALALARTGKRVALVDLDLHSPALHRFFDFPTRPGFTDAALGTAPLSEVVHRVRNLNVALTSSSANGRSASLNVVASGTLPLNPGEFVESKAAANVLQELRDSHDIVIVDVPPLLPVSDAISLSGFVDAVIVLARIGLVERPSLREAARILQRCPAAKLGVVVTGAAAEQEYYYGYGQGGQRELREPERVT